MQENAVGSAAPRETTGNASTSASHLSPPILLRPPLEKHIDSTRAVVGTYQVPSVLPSAPTPNGNSEKHLDKTIQSLAGSLLPPPTSEPPSHRSAPFTHAAHSTSHQSSSPEYSDQDSRPHSSAARRAARNARKEAPGRSRLNLPEQEVEMFDTTAGWIRGLSPFKSGSNSSDEQEEEEPVIVATSTQGSAASASRKGKGRQLETLNGRPLIPLTNTPEASVSQQASSSYVSVEQRLPIRIRRVGALGISVSSESGEGSRQLRDRDMEETGTDKDSRESRPKSVSAGVDAFDYRGIVDELSAQNQILKSRLRRYQAIAVPTELKNERLFEVRFFDGLPSDKREELESFLKNYVQGLAGIAQAPALPTAAPAFPFPATPAVPPSAKPAKLKTSRTASRSQTSQSLPTPLRTPGIPSIPSHSFVATPPLVSRPPTPPVERVRYRPISPVATPIEISRSVSPPLSAPRKMHHQRRKLTDRESLAAPSNSGLEPISFSGTGNGMRVLTIAPEERGRKTVVDINPPKLARVGQMEEAKVAVKVVEVLERLFFESLQGEVRADSSTRVTGTNESYLGRLLAGNGSTNGWTYLRLVCTFANIHRFSVTLGFVQAAIRAFSTRLELSQDGGMVRWIGSRPKSLDTISKVGARSQVGSEGISSTVDSDLASSSDRGVIRSLVDSATKEPSTAATSIAMKSAASVPFIPAGRVIRPAGHSLAIPPTTSAPPAPSSPFAISLARQMTTSSYTPFFERRESDVIARSPDEHMLPVDGAEIAGSTSAYKKRAEGTGTVVYFSNPHFCSDLSTDHVPAVLYRLEEDVDEAVAEAPVVASKEVSPEIELEVEDASSDIQMFDGENEFVQPTSPTTRQLRISGTTEVVPADLFTLHVKTLHPRPSLVKPSPTAPPYKRKRSNSLLDSLSHKFPRPNPSPALYSHRIIANRVVFHHVSAVPRRVPRSNYASSTGSTASSLSSRGSGKRNHAIPEIVVPDLAAEEDDAPPSDYLLSLSFPFFAWAPVLTGIAALETTRSSSAIRSSFRDYEDGAVEGADAEGPIDLDECVVSRVATK